MKASTVIALAAATFVSAQGLDSIPPCALSCAISSLGSTGCATTDIACICQATAFVTSLVPCVQGACSAEQFDATVQAAGALCQAAGVTLTIPTASSAPSSTSSVVSTVSSTAVSTVTSVSVVPTTTEVSTTLLTSTASNATVTSTPSGNSSVTQPPAPTGTDDSAAGRNAVAIGGLGAIAALVAAFL